MMINKMRVVNEFPEVRVLLSVQCSPVESYPTWDINRFQPVANTINTDLISDVENDSLVTSGPGSVHSLQPVDMRARMAGCPPGFHPVSLQSLFVASSRQTAINIVSMFLR